MEVTITPITANTTVEVTVAETSAAISPISSSFDFIEPSPDNLYAFNAVLQSTPTDVVSANAIASLSNIGVAADVQVNVGVTGHSPFQSELQGFKNLFKGFNSSASSFSHGDLVYFIDNDDYSADYNSSLEAVNVTSSLYSRASLFIFLSYSSNNLYVMKKGYIDYPDDSSLIINWSAGKTLYIDKDNKLNTVPVFNSGNYVRSVGYCVPNKENKKRVWFESDSTYVKKS